MEKEQVIDKIIYLTGYFRGISNVLRSSGNVDPLTLSGDFESIARDMAMLQSSIEDILFPSDSIEESNEKD